MKTSVLSLRFCAVAITVFFGCCLAVGFSESSKAAVVISSGQTLDLGGAAANNADVSSFESLGSVFFDADSPEQDSGVTDPGNPNSVNDKDLRDNLPSYLTIGPGAEFAGVSGGWGYQQILVGDGNSPDPFESGVAISAGAANANAGEIVTFTAGVGVVSDLRVGVIVDILDNAAFAPSSLTIDVGGSSATSVAAAGNQIGDIYQFDVTGIVPGDVISVSVGDSTAFTSTIAGVVFDVAEPFPLEMIVNTISGEVTLENNSPFSTDAVIQGYSIASAGDSLAPGSWNSLQEQGFDGGNTDPIDGIGWEQLGAGTSSLVSEFKLDGASAVSTGSTISLGQLFQSGGAEDLVFEVSTGSGVVPITAITYDNTPPAFLADFDNDGDVDADDLNGAPLGWQSRYGADLDGNDFLNWQRELGSGSPVGAAAAVPEPEAIFLLAIAIVAVSSCSSLRLNSRIRT